MCKLTSLATTIGFLTSTAIVLIGSPASACCKIEIHEPKIHVPKIEAPKVPKINVQKDVGSAGKAISHAEKATQKGMGSAGKALEHVEKTTVKSSGIENVAKASSKSIVNAVEHPEEEAKALQKDAVGLEKDAKTDASDIAHGNFSKLMKDTANQENAIDEGISKATGVSTDTLKTFNAIAGGAEEKLAVHAAEHPEETLKALKKDGVAVEKAARTDAADIASGNAAKLLRDTTNQDNALIAAQIRAAVAVEGIPVPPGVLKAGITFATTLNKWSTGQGAAEIIEALAHGKNGAALLMTMNDMNTLQGNGILNATNHVVSKDTGISTGVLNTTEQIGMFLAGGGESAVASDAAKVVAKESVEAASKGAVEAGMKAATEAAAKQAAEAAVKQTAEVGAKGAAKVGAEGAVEAAAKAGAEDAAKSVAKTAAKDAKDVTSAGAKEAAEVIPKGIVQERVAAIENKIAKVGIEDATKAGAKAATEEVAKTGAKVAAEETAKVSVKEATESATKKMTDTAADALEKEKFGFDDMVKSRLAAAAKAAAKDAATMGLGEGATKMLVEEAVKKEGETIVSTTGKLGGYAAKSRMESPDKLMETIAGDAAYKGAGAAYEALGEGVVAAAKAGKEAAVDYASRIMADSRFADEIAARASAKIDRAFVVDSLYKFVTDPNKLLWKTGVKAAEEGAHQGEKAAKGD